MNEVMDVIWIMYGGRYAGDGSDSDNSGMDTRGRDKEGTLKSRTVVVAIVAHVIQHPVHNRHHRNRSRL